nr:unnamed protein product [Digitaria exilis]
MRRVSPGAAAARSTKETDMSTETLRCLPSATAAAEPISSTRATMAPGARWLLPPAAEVRRGGTVKEQRIANPSKKLGLGSVAAAAARRAARRFSASTRAPSSSLTRCNAASKSEAPFAIPD